MSNTSSNVQVGPGLFGLGVIASVALAILKLTDVLAITWLIVALPAVVGAVITVLFILLGLGIIAAIVVFSGR